MGSMEKNKILFLPVEHTTYWKQVSEALERKLLPGLANSSKDAHAHLLFDVIRSYRTDYHRSNGYNCRNLQQALQRYRPIPSSHSVLINSLAQVCLQSANEPHLQVNLLTAGKDGTNRLSDKDVLKILAHGFFCTFKERDTDKYQNYSCINFIRLFTEERSGSAADAVKVEKLMCLLAYFDIMLHGDGSNSSRTITYERVTNPKRIDWRTSKERLIPIEFSKLPIEQSGCDLHVDFANKYLGGGTLGNGAVQEEIYFITCPELIAAQLFTQQLGDDDVLFVTGFETFSRFSGYSNGFVFQGRVNSFPSNASRFSKSIVAMDALSFHSRDEYMQYKEDKVERELHKCHVAFGSRNFSKIATGNWGCGAFGGDPQLKLLLQWMVASSDRKQVVFHMIDNSVKEELEKLATEAKKSDIPLGEIYRIVLKYNPSGRRKLIDYATNCIANRVKTSHAVNSQQGSRSPSFTTSVSHLTQRMFNSVIRKLKP